MFENLIDSLQDGFRAAIVAGLTGFLLSIVLTLVKVVNPAMASSAAIVELVLFVGSIVLITKLEYMVSGYLIGYISAEWVLSAIGLENSGFVVIYTIIGGH
jgi:hypothetical protein